MSALIWKVYNHRSPAAALHHRLDCFQETARRNVSTHPCYCCSSTVLYRVQLTACRANHAELDEVDVKRSSASDTASQTLGPQYSCDGYEQRYNVVCCTGFTAAPGSIFTNALHSYVSQRHDLPTFPGACMSADQSPGIIKLNAVS